MSSGFLNTTAKAQLDELLGSGSGATWPANVFISLHVGGPNPGVDGSSFVEPVGNGYARVSSARAADWDPAVDGSPGQADKTHNTTIAFPQAVGGAWGLATHFGVHDSGGGGNLLHWGPLDSNVIINAGDDQRFNPGGLKVRLSNVA